MSIFKGAKHPIELSDRKFILLVIKISSKEIWEVTKEYENGSKIQFQAFT